jgi:L-fuculose-phosphate aldolase
VTIDGDRERALREGVLATARAMNAFGINRGKSGNVSARFTTSSFDGYLITATGMPYAQMLPEDVVAMAIDSDDTTASGARAPSSEWRFHRDIYRARANVTAVVHAHSPFATALACVGRDIPAFHYMVAIAGGHRIPCARYATFGSQALSDAVLEALQGCTACLLANHGMIATGETLDAALALAVDVETLAEMYWRALQIGEPVLLSDDEMALNVTKFRSYGRPERPNRAEN